MRLVDPDHIMYRSALVRFAKAAWELEGTKLELGLIAAMPKHVVVMVRDSDTFENIRCATNGTVLVDKNGTRTIGFEGIHFINHGGNK